MADERHRLLACFFEHRDALQCFLQRRLNDFALAEELAQETWLRAASTRNAAAIDNPRGFLFRIASNLAPDQQRHKPCAGSWCCATARTTRTIAGPSGDGARPMPPTNRPGSAQAAWAKADALEPVHGRSKSAAVTPFPETPRASGARKPCRTPRPSSWPAGRRVGRLRQEATPAQARRRPRLLHRANRLCAAVDVKLSAEQVTVTVMQHRVEVSTGPHRKVELGRGEQVRYVARDLQAPRPADLPVADAWRRDRRVFQDAALGEVVADLERSRGGRIVLTDSRLRALPVTAVFGARQADVALATIAGILPVTLHRVTDWLIVLSPKGIAELENLAT